MENEIIFTALENLYKNTGIKARYQPSRGKLDGALLMFLDQHRLTFFIEIKKELRHHQLPLLESYYAKYGNLLVVAEHIFPRIKEDLRKKGIAYLEANGNIFLKRGDVYCFIDTNSKPLLKRETANRAFTKTGLKVVFHLLQNKDLILRTQREIAEAANVGLGNIPQVVKGLKDTGYLIANDKQHYLWQDRKGLLDRWINEYATELRPKLMKGRYAMKHDWRSVRLDSAHTVWGGEPAADMLTAHLRPERFTVYTNEKQTELMKSYHFVPQDRGELEVLELFWEPDGATAPPLLIYADLILTGGKRNIETAQRIYDEFILPIL